MSSIDVHGRQAETLYDRTQGSANIANQPSQDPHNKSQPPELMISQMGDPSLSIRHRLYIVNSGERTGQIS